MLFIFSARIAVYIFFLHHLIPSFGGLLSFRKLIFVGTFIVCFFLRILSTFIRQTALAQIFESFDILPLLLSEIAIILQ